MKKIIFFYILLFISLTANAKIKHSVVYGEHSNKVKTLENNTYRIFMDMNGHFYPENIILNKELLSNGKSQLIVWAQKYPKKFQLIAESYNLESTSYSENNYIILQDSIRRSIINIINKFETSQQTWIIHGFRKKITNENIDNSTSISENIICINRINKFIPNNLSNLNVEIYWDGKYMLKGGFVRAVKLGLLFKNKAIPNAQNCGYSLRNIFNKIKCQKIRIITHSAATHLVSSLLFNIKKNYTLPTPAQSDIRIALTASASSGKKFFKNYYNRNTSIDYITKDNYSLFNFINEKDFVLLKKKGFVKLPRMLGNTTLGCNFKNESGELKDYFTNNFTNSFYGEGYNNDNSNHWFKSYIQSKGFIDVLMFLYD